MKKEREQILELIRKTIRQREPSANIILYGSRARGDAHEGSDWDVVVIVDKPYAPFDEKGHLDYILWSKGLEIGEEINTLEYTRTQWDNLPPSLFKYNILNEGITL